MKIFWENASSGQHQINLLSAQETAENANLTSQTKTVCYTLTCQVNANHNSKAIDTDL